MRRAGRSRGYSGPSNVKPIQYNGNRPISRSNGSQQFPGWNQPQSQPRPQAGQPQASKPQTPQAGQPQASKPQTPQAGQPQAARPQTPQAGQPQAARPQTPQAAKPQAPVQGGAGKPSQPENQQSQADAEKKLAQKEALRKKYDLPPQNVQDAMKNMNGLLGKDKLGGADGIFNYQDVKAITNGMDLKEAVKDPEIAEGIRKAVIPNAIAQANAAMMQGGIPGRIAQTAAPQQRDSVIRIASNPSLYYSGAVSSGGRGPAGRMRTPPINVRANAEWQAVNGMQKRGDLPGQKLRDKIGEQMTNNMGKAGVKYSPQMRNDMTPRNVSMQDLRTFEKNSQVVRDYIKANPDSRLAKEYDPSKGADSKQLTEGLKKLQMGEGLAQFKEDVTGIADAAQKGFGMAYKSFQDYQKAQTMAQQTQGLFKDFFGGSSEE